MSYLIKNAEVLKMLEALARSSGRTKVDVLKDALHRLEEEDHRKPTDWEATLKAGLELRALGDPERGLPADKAFIDSLYEDDDVPG